MQTFAEQLKMIRKEQHLTQEDLAQMMNVSRTTISRWESGKALPDIESIKILSQKLNYNFFAVENEAEEKTAAPETVVPRKSKRVWQLVMGGLCLLVLFSGLLWSLSGKNDATLPSAEESADIVVALSTEIAYLEPFFDSNGYGWLVNFYFENQSDVPFTPAGVEMTFYENERIYQTQYKSYDDIKAQMRDGKLVKGGQPVDIMIGANLMNLTHVVCRMYGVDDNGNQLSVSGTIRYSRQSPVADEAERKEYQDAAAANPEAAYIVATPAADKAYQTLMPNGEYGWDVVFFFQNYSDVAYTPAGMEISYYENETLLGTLNVPQEELAYHTMDGKIYKNGDPLKYPVGTSSQNITHITCRMFGTDANGNEVEACATVQLLKETGSDIQ